MMRQATALRLPAIEITPEGSATVRPPVRMGTMASTCVVDAQRNACPARLMVFEKIIRYRQVSPAQAGFATVACGLLVCKASFLVIYRLCAAKHPLHPDKANLRHAQSRKKSENVVYGLLMEFENIIRYCPI